MRVAILFLCLFVAVHSGPIAQEDSVLRIFVNNFVNCMNSDVNLCLKEHALKATERLSSARQLDLIEGVTLINNEPREAKSLDTLSEDPEERNKQVTERLWTTTSELLRRSDLELSYGGDDIIEEKESRAINDVEESRGKKKKLKKKLKMLIPLAILGKIKAIILIVVALLIIAASVFKLALLAKIAFIVKVIAIIKALIAKKSAHEETSWVPYEEHGHGGGGWEGGWSRSKNEANNLAYSAYNQ